MLGEKDWNKIAAVVERRTARQCRERFKNHLKEGIKKGPWSPEEDSLILKVKPAPIARPKKWCGSLVHPKITPHGTGT